MLTIRTKNIDKTFNVVVTSSSTIDEVKAKIQGKKGIHPSYITLVWHGKKLHEGYRPISEYNVDTDEVKLMYMAPHVFNCFMVWFVYYVL